MRRHILYIVSVLLYCSASFAITRLHFDGNDSFISQRQETTVEGGTGVFTASFHYSDITKGIRIIVDPQNGHTSWGLDFSGLQGQRLEVGTYLSARRYPFQATTEPGLAIYGDGRECNQIFGEFQVLEIEYSGDLQSVVRFAANFTQYCETLNSEPLGGFIYYNSTLTPPEATPTPTPSPTVTNTPAPGEGCNSMSLKNNKNEDVEVSTSGNYVYASDAQIGVLLQDGETRKTKSNKASIAARYIDSKLSLTATKGKSTVKKTIKKITQAFLINHYSELNGLYWITESGEVFAPQFSLTKKGAKLSVKKVGESLSCQ